MNAQSLDDYRSQCPCCKGTGTTFDRAKVIRAIDRIVAKRAPRFSEGIFLDQLGLDKSTFRKMCRGTLQFKEPIMQKILELENA